MAKTFMKIWEYSSKRHSSLIKALIFSFLRSVFGITQLLAIIITIQILTGNGNAQSGIKWIIILTLICIAGNFFTSYMEQINTMNIGFFMIADKRVKVGNILRKVPLGFFNDASTGQITATLTTTLSGVETASVMSMVGIVSGLFQTLALFLFMMYYDWKIGLISGTGMIVYLFVVNWQMKVSRKNAPALQKAQNRLAECTLTFLQGIKVTKAFSFLNGDKKLKEAVKNSRDANIELTDRSMPSQFASHLTIAVFESIILMTVLYSGFVTGEFSISKTIILIIFSFMVYASLDQAGSMLSMIGLLDSGLSEVDQIEKAEQMECLQPEQKSRSNEIVFDNVSFSYGDHEVLHNISTTIKENTFTAVIGPSGSGKTTLCQLIPRFRDVSSGKITIGGADIKHMQYEELMSKIIMVFQKVFLFEYTILNNIRFGKPDATLEEVREAAKAARCDSFIMSLPNGYDTYVKESGSSLSGGEKQRISIARAILKNAPIIILDEATSALDAENEHEILEAIDELTKNKTVIMIAHRIKSVQQADKIIAIKDGRIVQEGQHSQLIKQEGLYKDFLCAREKATGWKIHN